MDLSAFFQRELNRKGWRTIDLARAYGADKEGRPPESINVQRYNSTVSRVLSNPDSARFDTIRTIVRILGYRIILSPIDFELVEL